MITTRGKWIALAVTAVLLSCLVLAETLGTAGNRESTAAYDRVGGVAVTMPDDSMKLFLEGYFGIQINEYVSYPDFESARMALDSGRVSSIWVTDATADNLEQDGSFRSIESQDPPGRRAKWFSFAFAFRKEDAELCKLASSFIEEKNGIVFDSDSATLTTVKSSVAEEKPAAGSKQSGSMKPLYIGVTCAVPPLEMQNGQVFSGTAVELAREWAESLGRKPVFVKLTPGDEYIKLLAGSVDMLAVSATSENHSLTVPKYITSTGYLEMNGYRLVTKTEGEKRMSGLIETIKDNLISGGAYRKILSAAATTVLVTVIAFAVAALFGFLFLKLLGHRNRIVRGMAGGAAYVLKSIPALLLVLLLGFGVFGATGVPALIPAAFGIGLFGAGLLAEAGQPDCNVRSFLSFLGTKKSRKTAVNILQWTTVVSCLGVNDVAGVMQTIGKRTLFPVFSIVCSVLFYLILVILLERIPYTDSERAVS